MRNQAAFSLVEVTLAIGIVAFALLAILGLIPIGQTSTRDATDDTRTSLIGRDVSARVRAVLNSSTGFANASTTFPSPPTGPNFYYTNEGTFFCNAANLSTALANAKLNGEPLPNYAVTVIVGTNFANPLPNVSNSYLKPVAARIGWPLDSNGSVVGPVVAGVQANAERKVFTFYIRKS